MRNLCVQFSYILIIFYAERIEDLESARKRTEGIFLYILSQDILDYQFAQLLDIYKYLGVKMMFIQNYGKF